MMNLLKLITFLSILLSGLTWAKSDLDNYYNLESEVAKLRAEFRDNQGLISEHNTTSNNFWSPSSTKKILDRLHKDQDRILKEMKPKVDEMKRLEQSLEVQAWDYRFGALEQVNTLLGNVSQNNTCSAQGQQLFTSDKAFEAWNAQNGDIDRKVAYYAEKNGYISNCLKTINDGEEKKVEKRTSRLCKKDAKELDPYSHRIDSSKHAYRTTTGNYTLSKKRGQLVISTSIYFLFKGEEKDREEAFRVLEDTKKCIVNFYAKSGIKLDLTFYYETGPRDKQVCDHFVNLHTRTNRADSGNWATEGAANPNMSNSNRCALYLHELGHKLNLPDTYPDPACPDREIISPIGDIMRVGSYGQVEDSKLYPYAIKEMLGDICE
ncbi:hypothetical protein OAT67_00755 [Bacteriovoracaceae bacterium]|nr:hypothetical protein [Bacteriovoracaceae bacterium]